MTWRFALVLEPAAPDDARDDFAPTFREIDPAAPALSVGELSTQRGDGIFESIGVVNGHAQEVVPHLEAEIRIQEVQFDDTSSYVPNARRFHEALVSRCGNEPMILLVGSLELIWSAHESAVWSDETAPDGGDAAMNVRTMRAALRDHQRLTDAIRDGNQTKAIRLARDHLAAARRNTLAFGMDKTIEARLIAGT